MPGAGRQTELQDAGGAPVAELGDRIGSNLNQLAREKNITGLRPVGAFEPWLRAVAR